MSINANQGKTENTNEKQNQGTCAASCGVNQAYIGEGSATSPGATQVNANHIIQYPRQPKMDDGKWIAIGSLLGALLGKMANKNTIDKAKDAEAKWRELNDALYNKGREMWNMMPDEKAEADKADNDLEAHYDWNVGRRDAEAARAMKLDNCSDSLYEKICQFSQCGYTPDYDGIKSRIMADVAQQSKKRREELCKNLNRYSVSQCCGIETAIATSAMSTTVGALYKAREDERARAWQINEGLLFKAAELVEKTRGQRMEFALNIDKTAIGIQQSRYDQHNKNWFQLATLGAEFLSAAGKNFAWLAESYRRTAEKMGDDLAKLGGLIALVLTIWLGKTSGENDCGGKKEEPKKDEAKPTPTPGG